MPGEALWRVAREHWLLLVALGVGLLLRVAVEVAYAPALFYTDSWAYVSAAYSGQLMSDSLHTAGYPASLQLLAIGGRSLLLVTTLQHLAGLATAVLVYGLLTRLQVRRPLAALAAAVLVADSYAIALEQKILSEAVFTLALIASLWVAAWSHGKGRSLAASGLLLALAVLLRPVALFALPVWLVYVLWTKPGPRAVTLAAAAAILPLVTYAVAHQVKQRELGFTSASGWQLYGRIGQIVNCDGMNLRRELTPLCARHVAGRHPVFYIFDPRSPARRVYEFSSNPATMAHGDNELRRFALATIRHRPVRYARVVGSDFLRYFKPGAMSDDTSDRAVQLPSSPQEVPVNRRVVARWLPSYSAHVRAPAAALRAYAHAVHSPRWAVAPLCLLGVLALLLPPLSRGRVGLAPHRREIFLLLGSAIAMLIGSAAFSNFEVRYLVPALPPVLAGGLLAASDLSSQLRAIRLRRPRGLSRAGRQAAAVKSQNPTSNRVFSP